MRKTAVMRMAIAAMMWVADLASLIRDTGRVIDFDYIENLSGANAYRRGSFAVQLAEDVAIGETSVNVDALENALNKGSKIDFGTYAPVTVTVSASALANATSIAVNALSGPIPKGQIIYFGSKKFAVVDANAAAGATTITTLALPTALAGGEVGTWQGGHKVLILSADAEAGATTITVEAPLFEIADNTVGYAVAPYYKGIETNEIFIEEGTVMVEVDPSTNRKIIPLALHPDGTSATGQTMVLLTNAKSYSTTDALSGYGVTYGGSLFENIMPDAIKNGGTLPSGWKTFLGARYIWLKSRDARGE